MAAIDQTLILKEIANISKTVGVISDTHVPSQAKSVPTEVFKAFEGVDYIIHAGDLVELSVIDELEQIAPVLAVSGNMDTPEVNNVLPKLNSLKIFEWKIGVMHDPNALWGITKMKQIAKENSFDAFIYGHTHSANLKWDNNVLFLNPGSPINASVTNRSSVALLKVSKENIVPEIIHLFKRRC